MSAPTTPTTCPNCGSPASGHFCANCGAPLAGARRAEGGAVAAEGAPVAPFAGGAAGGGPAPDISSMSPEERAARLFDRVMRYDEQGKRDSLLVFAPMALNAYEMIGTLDTDQRYDLGRI